MDEWMGGRMDGWKDGLEYSLRSTMEFLGPNIADRLVLEKWVDLDGPAISWSHSTEGLMEIHDIIEQHMAHIDNTIYYTCTAKHKI